MTYIQRVWSEEMQQNARLRTSLSKILRATPVLPKFQYLSNRQQTIRKTVGLFIIRQAYPMLTTNSTISLKYEIQSIVKVDRGELL